MHIKNITEDDLDDNADDLDSSFDEEEYVESNALSPRSASLLPKKTLTKAICHYV